MVYTTHSTRLKRQIMIIIIIFFYFFFIIITSDNLLSPVNGKTISRVLYKQLQQVMSVCNEKIVKISKNC